MADMTREQARKLVYVLTQFVDGQITSSEEIKAMEMLIEDSKKLEAYENADLIERQAVLEDMGNTYNLYLNDQNHFDREDMVVVNKTYDFINKGIYDIPRFNPERQVQNE